MLRSHIHFLQLLRIALNNAERMGHTLDEEEWAAVMGMAVKQGVVGVAFCGVERLPKEELPPVEVIMDWSAVADYVERENRKVNKVSVDVCRLFRTDGRKVCILKGQGMSVLYPMPLRRASGDVDVWMKGEKEEVVSYVRARFCKVGDAGGHHVSVMLDGGVDMEVHYLPAELYVPWHQRRLCRFFDEVEAMQWENEAELPEGVGRITVPTAGFNLVFILVHLFHHWAFEGCGMKQLMDYYWLVESVYGQDESGKSQAVKVLRQVGLGRFLEAVMYIYMVWGMKREHLLCPPCERLGRLLLEDVLRQGVVTADDLAVGMYSWKTRRRKLVRRWKRMWRVMPLAPSEVPWMLAKNVYGWLLGRWK